VFFNSNQMSVGVDLAHGIAYFVLSAGVVTSAAALTAIQIALSRGLVASAPLAYVADFRAPLWAVTEEDLNEALKHEAHDVPAALVVTEAAAPLFRAHAWAAAQSGCMRKVFMDYERACAWASLQASLEARSQTAP
jgi:hypothetical protein